MSELDLKALLLELGQAGCQGNLKDYGSWIEYRNGGPVDGDAIQSTMDGLLEEGAFTRHPEFQNEFLAATPPEFPARIEYSVSGMLDDSPIQHVRSRLESFLRFHNVGPEAIIDLSIGTTEAMENAVKYSDHKNIDVSYVIENGEFHIKVVNRMGEVAPEKDIESGKYTSSVTLMRGMMVMVKLFDEMDIDISDEQKEAIFTASKKV